MNIDIKLLFVVAAGLVFTGFILWASACDIKSIFLRVLTCIGIWITTSAGLCYIFGANTPREAAVSAAIAFILPAVLFGLGLNTIKPSTRRVYQPVIRPKEEKILNEEEWRTRGPGLGLEWTLLEEHLAEVYLGKIILDGSDVSTIELSANGVVEIRCKDGTAYVPFRLEVSPFTEVTPATLKNFGLFVRTIESGQPLTNSDSRTRVIKGGGQAIIAQVFEFLGKETSVFDLTASSLQEDLKTKKNSAGVILIESIRKELEEQFGLDPSKFLLKVGDIKFSKASEETLDLRTKNKMAADIAENFLKQSLPKTPKEFEADLLERQEKLLVELKATPAIDLAKIKEGLQKEQQKQATAKLRILEAKKAVMPEVKDFISSLGAKSTPKAASDYAAAYATLEGEIVEMKAQKKTDADLVGEFKTKFEAKEAEAKVAKKRIDNLESGVKNKTLAPEFKDMLSAYDATRAKAFVQAQQLAAAGVLDITFIATPDISGDDGADPTSKMRTVMETLDALGTNRKGGGK